MGKTNKAFSPLEHGRKFEGGQALCSKRLPSRAFRVGKHPLRGN